MACGYLSCNVENEQMLSEIVWNFNELTTNNSVKIENISHRNIEISDLPNSCEIIGSDILTIEGDDRHYSLVQRSFWP